MNGLMGISAWLATSLIDAAIPSTIGVLILIFPKWFFKPGPHMPEEQVEKRLQQFRVIGMVLVGVGLLYAFLAGVEQR